MENMNNQNPETETKEEVVKKENIFKRGARKVWSFVCDHKGAVLTFVGGAAIGAVAAEAINRHEDQVAYDRWMGAIEAAGGCLAIGDSSTSDDDDSESEEEYSEDSCDCVEEDSAIEE